MNTLHCILNIGGVRACDGCVSVTLTGTIRKFQLIISTQGQHIEVGRHANEAAVIETQQVLGYVLRRIYVQADGWMSPRNVDYKYP